jgi:hypothetical protein
LDDKFKEIYIEQKKKMINLGLIGEHEMACSERRQRMGKLDKEIEESLISDVSYEPIWEGPAPKLDKPTIVPSLDFNKMAQNLAKERKKPGKRKRSDPVRRANSQDNSVLLPDMLDSINHNKYGKKQKEEELMELELLRQQKKAIENQQKYEYDDDYDEGSSPWSCSYCMRKGQTKGGLEELLAMNDIDPNESNSHSFHSSILHDNRKKYQNIRDLRRLYEVMDSAEKN